ncbi:MAG: type II toxin-antitoxin system RelE/ParE family toxin [Chitinophagales bacterium]|nr:type II toxin-antitoxin system RelE/ParE family toxin [Chitinophagales bacterium]
MIVSIKHKGLKLFWEYNNGNKLPANQLKKISIILQVIDELNDVPNDLKGLVYLRPHALKGNLKGFWSLDVSGNYRIIFRFENGDAYDIDYLDTH